MIKNNNGVTLMSLIITVVVMMILVSVVGYYSIEGVRNSYIAREKKELSNVVEYVSLIKAKLLIDDFNISDKFTDDTDPIITLESIYLIANSLPESYINKIMEVNTSNYLKDNYKYLYFTADKLNSESLKDSDIVIKDVRNNYIINFYTGTVIALYDNGKRIEISGPIKGLQEIMSELQ